MALYITIYFERAALQNYLTAIKISSVIAVAYGLYLTTMPGINPYLMISLPLFDSEFNQAYALGYSSLTENFQETVVQGRLFGRISSVFSHPMTYALNLGFFTILFTYLFRNKPKILTLSLLIMIISILFSGVRTVLAAIIVVMLFVLISLSKFKPMLYSGMIVALVVFITSYFFPSLISFVESIWQSDEAEISGSTMSLRFEQFWGCIDILRDNILTGNGYTWVSNYLKMHTTHPILLGFESLLFSTLCNSGILGCIIWIITGITFTLMIKRIVKEKYKQTLLLSLFFFYVTYALITGDYDYMKYFMLYYTVALGFCMSSKRTKTISVR